MPRRKADAVPRITQPRAARLYRLLVALSRGPQGRDALGKKLRLDARGFYRDLDVLRKLGIEITATDAKYHLGHGLDDALARLPVPDPGLSVREALVLCRGGTDVHRKFRRTVESLLGITPAGKAT